MSNLPVYPTMTERLREIESRARQAVDADRAGNEAGVQYHLQALLAEVAVALITNTPRPA